ncbi:extensin-like [Perognathus longimembris pacificus]|uniref:extensin-like n=1 Tax=Perognathus longimembris pacificus TaxID=214514 RepID=UPI002019153F|nr:extensin-like [Perognathus longimembris pacificus]
MKSFTCLLGLLALISCFTPIASHRGYRRFYDSNSQEELDHHSEKPWHPEGRPAPPPPNYPFMPGQVEQFHPPPHYPGSMSSQYIKNPWNRWWGHIPHYPKRPKKMPCVPRHPLPRPPSPPVAVPPSPSPTPEIPTTTPTTTAVAPTAKETTTEFPTVAPTSSSTVAPTSPTVEPTTPTKAPTPPEGTTPVTTSPASADLRQWVKTVFDLLFGGSP